MKMLTSAFRMQIRKNVNKIQTCKKSVLKNNNLLIMLLSIFRFAKMKLETFAQRIKINATKKMYKKGAQ